MTLIVARRRLVLALALALVAITVTVDPARARTALAAHAVSTSTRTDTLPHGDRSGDLGLLYELVARHLVNESTYIYLTPPDTIGVERREEPEWWKACHLTPIVSEHGMADLARINRGLLRLMVRPGSVVSADHCTAMSTATFVTAALTKTIYPTTDFNPIEVQVSLGLRPTEIRAKVASQFRVGFARRVNLLVGFPIPAEIAPHPVLADLKPGETAIFGVGADDNPELIARLSPAQWEDMLRYVERKALTAAKSKRRSLPTKQ